MSERSLLAQMLWELKEAGEGLSYSKMAARSGGLVAVSTLHGVMSDKTKELTPDTITGLARILGVSEAQILAALRGKPLKVEEEAEDIKNKFWEMYSDIPRQCQQDVMDLLAVLQRNHSISARREQHTERRRAFASVGREHQEADESATASSNTVTGPTRLATPVSSLPLAEGKEDSTEQPAARAANDKKTRNGT